GGEGQGDGRGVVVGDPVGLVVVVELDARVGGEIEGDVGAVRDGVEAVVLVPGVVERGLVLVASGGQREGSLPDVVARVVGQVRGRARGIPVAPAARLRLQGTGDRDRRRARRRGGGGEQDEGGRPTGGPPTAPAMPAP